MRHLDEGQLRAYYDGALGDSERKRVRDHLAACPQCARQAANVQERSARVDALLASMDPQPAREPVAPCVTWHRLTRYVEQKKEQSMLRNVFARRYRPVWAAVALVLAFAVAFSFAPVRALAGDLLGLFRVKRIEFVEVNPAQMPDEEALEDALRMLEAMGQGGVDLDFEGEVQDADVPTARALPEFAVRFPTALEDEPQVKIKPGSHATMQIDLPRVRTLLAELGYSHVNLPDSLDGAEVAIDFHTLVTALYGPCHDRTRQDECTVLLQMPAPGLSAPAELDVDQLGRAYLQLLGLSESEAERFSQRVDWTTTLVVPMPRSANPRYQDVSVDGVIGTLVRPAEGARNAQEYLLTWIKDDIVYGLSGTGETTEVVQIADSLQ